MHIISIYKGFPCEKIEKKNLKKLSESENPKFEKVIGN